MQGRNCVFGMIAAMIAALFVPGGAARERSAGKAGAELGFQIESSEVLPLPNAHFSVARRAPDGALWFLAADRWAVHRIQPGSPASSFGLHAIPEASRADVRLSRSLAVDARGRIYIPGVWSEWGRGSTAKAGIFVLDERGRPTQTITLPLQMDPAQVAVDDAGNLIVLGWTESAMRRGGECQLLHRFAPDGTHHGSFSPCPQRAALAAPSFDERRSAFLGLKDDVLEGLLWSRGDRIYHVLPGERLLRIFTGGGLLVQEATFQPPESSRLLAEAGARANPAGDRIHRLVPLPDGRYLVEWLHVEAVGRSGQRRATFLALHDSQGRPLTRAAHPVPAHPSVPVDCDPDGRVLFLHLTREGGEKVMLIRASVVLRPAA